MRRQAFHRIPWFIVILDHRVYTSVGVRITSHRRIVLLFLISVSSATPSFGGVSVEAGSEASAVVTAVRGYGVKAQAAGAASAALIVGLAGPFGAGVGFGLQGALPSDAAGDWRLRSFAGGRVAAFLDLQGVLAGLGDAGDLLVGVRLGGSVTLSGYPYTRLLALWPSVTVEPGLAFSPSWLDSVDLRISIPGAFHFRSDVEYSFSSGIALTVALRSGGRWAR